MGGVGPGSGSRVTFFLINITGYAIANDAMDGVADGPPLVVYY
jgi:hypothetical protein